MRWLFLLLVMLNAFYYAWHRQEVPLIPKEITPLSSLKGVHQDIRLLKESGSDQGDGREKAISADCIYLGGGISSAEASTIEQRLTSLDIQAQYRKRVDESGDVFWLKIAPESRRLVDEALLSRLRQDFQLLKSKIMSCEGIATAD